MKKAGLTIILLTALAALARSQVMDDVFKQKILTISEQDFWSSIAPTKGLEKAIAAGQAGKRDAAYRFLGDYHRKSLAVEAAAYREKLAAQATDASASARTREAADRVLRREIHGWAGQVIKFGPVIDFNANFGRSGQYGFHYLGWLEPELDQYVMSREPKYRDDFIAITKQYYDQRTGLVLRIPTLHPVYYELGAWAKTEIFLPAYAVLVGEKALDTNGREAMLKLLVGMARSLYRMQTEYRPGNWQIVGATALYHTAVSFPEFKESESWRAKALELLKEHAEKDFFADGGHGERCWGYGHMSLGAMATFYKIAVRHKTLDAASDSYWQAFLKRGYQWFAASTAPGGFVLNYGDGDISRSDGIIAEAIALFPDLGKGPGQLGIDRTRSNILRPSGYAFMRDGDAADAPFMSINFGNWGGGHTHQDLLDFSIWRFGQPLIEEVGRFGSYDNPLDPFFRSEKAHNQIVLESIPMNRKEHRGEDILWLSTEAADFFSGWHEGYPKVRVHRQIVFVKPDYWVVYDTILADEYIFQADNTLHGVRPFRILADGLARLEGTPSCLVISGRPEELRRLTTQVDYARKDYYGADEYKMAGERHRLTAMKWRDVGDQRPITFATLLIPFEGAEPPDIKLAPLAVSGDTTGQAEAYTVTWKGRTDTLVFNPARVSLTVAGRTVSAPMAAGVGGNWIELSADKP
jgi:Heparinase II/III N-terminus/Heparinase II/III-like protein